MVILTQRLIYKCPSDPFSKGYRNLCKNFSHLASLRALHHHRLFASRISGCKISESSQNESLESSYALSHWNIDSDTKASARKTMNLWNSLVIPAFPLNMVITPILKTWNPHATSRQNQGNRRKEFDGLGHLGSLSSALPNMVCKNSSGLPNLTEAGIEPRPTQFWTRCTLKPNVSATFATPPKFLISSASVMRFIKHHV
jgi:hypothetical protein